MSEVTNSATTLSSPAGHPGGKLKLLPLQHLREEEKKKQNKKTHRPGGKEKK